MIDRYTISDIHWSKWTCGIVLTKREEAYPAICMSSACHMNRYSDCMVRYVKFTLSSMAGVRSIQIQNNGLK